MRYEVLTNMQTKLDQDAAAVLLYVSQCKEAIKSIMPPAGITIQIAVAASTKNAVAIASRAHQMHLEMSKQKGPVPTYVPEVGQDPDFVAKTVKRKVKKK